MTNAIRGAMTNPTDPRTPETSGGMLSDSEAAVFKARRSLACMRDNAPADIAADVIERVELAFAALAAKPTSCQNGCGMIFALREDSRGGDMSSVRGCELHQNPFLLSGPCSNPATWVHRSGVGSLYMCEQCRERDDIPTRTLTRIDSARNQDSNNKRGE